MAKQSTSFRSAFPLRGGPVSPELILEFHRATFGGATMEEPDEAAKAAEKAAEEKAAAEAAAKERGFPEKTPVADMTIEEQANYWKYHARKREDAEKRARDYDAVVAERDQLREQHSTEAEKATAAARKEGEQAAATKYQGRLVRAELKAALKGIVPEDQLAGHVEFLDPSKFLTADGEVDTDKVTQYAGSVPRSAGGDQRFPDTGGGRRSNDDGKKTKAEAGKAEAERRFGKKKSDA